MTLTFTGLTLGSELDLEPDEDETAQGVQAYLYTVSKKKDPIRVTVEKQNDSDVWGFDGTLKHAETITYYYDDGLEESIAFEPNTITSEQAHAETYQIAPIDFAYSRSDAIKVVLRFGLFDGTNRTIFQISFIRT